MFSFRAHAQGAVTVSIALQQSERGHSFQPMRDQRRHAGLACARGGELFPKFAQGRGAQLFVALRDVGMDGEVVFEHDTFLPALLVTGRATF